MSDSTLSGTLSGLLRQCSPVRYHDVRHAIVYAVNADRGTALIFYAEGGHKVAREVRFENLALDLTDPTGRAHAAWWVRSRIGANGITSRKLHVVIAAERCAPMSDHSIAELRDICLKLAA